MSVQHVIHEPARLDKGEVCLDQYRLPHDENHPYSNHNPVWYLEVAASPANTKEGKPKKKVRGGNRKRDEKKVVGL